MRKAIITNKALLLFTLLFIIIAALSFAAFEKGEKVCAEAGKCSEVKPSITNGEMILGCIFPPAHLIRLHEIKFSFAVTFLLVLRFMGVC